MTIPNTTEAVFSFVSVFIDTNGYAPTRREIQDGCGLSSVSVADYHVQKLIDAGRFTQIANRARSLRVVERAKPEAEVIAEGIISHAYVFAASMAMAQWTQTGTRGPDCVHPEDARGERGTGGWR